MGESARSKCKMDPLNQNEIRRSVEINIIDDGQLTRYAVDPVTQCPRDKWKNVQWFKVERWGEDRVK